MSVRRSPIHARSKSGLSRTEVLFLIAVAIVLAAVAVGPMRVELQERRMNSAMESARTLNTLLAQYATDNNGVYPVGEGTRAEGTSEGIALDLLLNNYTPNADIFAVGSTPKYRGAAKDYADLGPQNMSWDFTAGATATTGITTAAPDWLPALYTTGETIDYYHVGNPQISGTGPFGSSGMVVAYKVGNVEYIDSKSSSLMKPRYFNNFFPGNTHETGTYTQIRP